MLISSWKGDVYKRQDPESGEIVSGTNNCMMCRRMILNAGIETVIIRDTKEEYRVIKVRDWITDDDSLPSEYSKTKK